MMDVKVARMTTFVLAGICGFLLLIALIQLAGYGRGYGWLPPETDTATPTCSIDRNLSRSPFSAFQRSRAPPLVSRGSKNYASERRRSRAGRAAAGAAQCPTLTGVIWCAIPIDARVAHCHGARQSAERIGGTQGRNAVERRSGRLDAGRTGAAPGHVQERQRRECRDRIEPGRGRTECASAAASSAGGAGKGRRCGSRKRGKRARIGSGQANRGTPPTNAGRGRTPALAAVEYTQRANELTEWSTCLQESTIV